MEADEILYYHSYQDRILFFQVGKLIMNSRGLIASRSAMHGVVDELHETKLLDIQVKIVVWCAFFFIL